MTTTTIYVMKDVLIRYFLKCVTYFLRLVIVTAFGRHILIDVVQWLKFLFKLTLKWQHVLLHLDNQQIFLREICR